MEPRLESPTFEGTERFVVETCLGRGAMGVVYRAFDRERQMQVALKTLLRVDPSTIYRFKEEFRALVDVAHPNLVSLYELVSTEDKWFFTMELLDGVDFVSYVRGRSTVDVISDTKTLSPRMNLGSVSVRDASLGRSSLRTAVLTQPANQLLDATLSGTSTPPSEASEACAPIDWERIRASLRQLILGVQALHASGHMHRDIKSSNVIVTPDGRVVLLDFGVIAELAGTRHRREARELVGTPAYVAPEQALGHISTASDLYSVGVMLYRVLTGGFPFVGSLESVLRAKQHVDAPPPNLRRPDTPDDLNQLCVDLLQRMPDKRPHAEEVLRRLTNEPAAQAIAASVAVVRSPAVGEVPSALVGRQTLLVTLREAFAATKRGVGATLLVHGSSGIGKSALVNHFLDEVAADEAVVLAGRCYEREQVPYKGVDAAIDALCRYLMSLPEAEVDALAPRDVLLLTKVFPMLKRVEVFARARRRTMGTLDLQELRRRAFAALRDLLARIAERRPLVIFIDDAQWGDSDSAPLLDELMRAPDVPPLLLLLGYRTEDADRSPLLRAMSRGEGRVATGAISRELAVGPLSEDAAKKLATDLLAPDGATAEAAAAIAHESRGHPYFIHELARHAREAGFTAEKGLSLDAVIAGRLARLPDQARHLMETVAVAGKPVAQRIAAAAAAVSKIDQPALINQLRVAQLVRSSGVRDLDLIECYHDRIRQTIAAQLDPGVLRSHHRRLASEYVASEHPDAETLVMHFFAAGEREAAGEYAVVAAAQAEDALSFDRAAELYRLALELRDNSVDQQRALKVKLAEALQHAGRGGTAAPSFVEASQLSTGLQALDLRRRAAEQYLISGYLDEGMEIVRNVVREVGLRFPETPLKAILGMLVRRAQLWLRGLAFRRRARDSMALAETMPVDVCWSVATGLSCIYPVRAGGFGTRGLLLALKLGDTVRVARAMFLETCFQACMGSKSLRRTAQLYEPAFEISATANDAGLTALATGIRGFVAFEQGEFANAHIWCEEGLALFKELPDVAWELDVMQRFSLVSLVFMGEPKKLRRLAPERLASAQQRGDLFATTNIRAFVSPYLSIIDGDPEMAIREAEDAMAKWGTKHGFHDQHFMALLMRAQADMYRGDGKRAYQRWQEVQEPLKGSLLLYVQVIRAYAWYATAIAALAAAAPGGTDMKRAQKLAQRNARKLEREGVTWASAAATLVRAGVAKTRGDDETTVAQLRLGADLFHKCAMGQHAASCRRLVGRMIKGTEGARLVALSDAWATEQEVRDMDRLSASILP